MHQISKIYQLCNDISSVINRWIRCNISQLQVWSLRLLLLAHLSHFRSNLQVSMAAFQRSPASDSHVVHVLFIAIIPHKVPLESLFLHLLLLVNLPANVAAPE